MITLVTLWALGLRIQAGPPPRVVDTVQVTVTVEQVTQVERDVRTEECSQSQACLGAASGSLEHLTTRRDQRYLHEWRWLAERGFESSAYCLARG